ncbi:CaiB/BaiF CoA transferase family protein [Pseudooceanicola sp.]|uniref:CaiB/BaiF CoA transferase family protein n=1 Tax=Pseudooceanicola sp. TaxID=1914328 RepID=UPI0035C68580
MTGTSPPLSGVKVTEFGGSVAAAYVGALLRACGADVVKVEPPGTGDPIRRLPPFAPDARFPEASGMQAFLDAGKRSIAIAAEQDRGRALCRDLALSADVVIEARGSGFLASIGLASPGDSDPVVLSLSWFGQDGPAASWQASDAVIQAMAAHIHAIGPVAGPPVIPGGYQSQISAGVTAYIGVMAALLGRMPDGPGVLVEQSVFEAYLAYAEPGAVRYAYEGEDTQRQGFNRFPPVYPQTIYPTGDGWLGVTVLTPPQWKACCVLLGLEDLIDDPRFNTSNLRYRNADDLDVYMLKALKGRSALDLFHAGQAERLPFALVPELSEIEELDHFRAREVFADYGHPDQGRFRAPAIPFNFGATPVLAGGTAPRLGAQAEEILRDRLSLGAEDIRALQQERVVSTGELMA